MNSEFPSHEISANKIPTEERDGIWTVLYKRLGFDRLEYPLPVHAQSLPYMLGGLTFATFMVLFVSGIYLTQFYNPNQLSSYQSLLYLISQAPFGNFMRSVHYWSVNAVFVLLIAHVTRVFITGSYKRPREFTWLMGLGLLVLAVLFTFAGTILALGQEGIEAMEHFSEVGLILGPLGLWFTTGFSAVVPLVGRIYVTHIIILPFLFFFFVIAHFYLMHVHNMSPKAEKDAVVGIADNEPTQPFTAHLKMLAGWSFILIAIIAILALLFPELLGKAGAAGVPIQEVKPRWMFLWLYGMEDVFSIKALVWGPLVLLFSLAIIPFIDRSPWLSPRKRPWMMVYGAVLTLILIAFSLQAVFAPTNMKAMRQKQEVRQESAMLPFFENFLPGKIAYAHDLVFLSFTPTTVRPGGVVNLIGDGIHQSGTYALSLKGPQRDISLGTAIVPKGNDSFNANLVIPPDIPGALYTIEVKNINGGEAFYAPLQLAVEPIAMPLPSQYPTDSQYPIPSSEVPWIVGFIVISLGVGVYLLSGKTSERASPK